MDDRALNELQRLAARDQELSERAQELRAVDDEVAAIRASAERVDAFLVAYPEEQARRSSEVEAASEDLADRRRGLDDAEHALSSAEN